MGVADILLMGLIIVGAVYLLYHSLWKKKGHCPGCDTGACHVDTSRAGNSCFTEEGEGKGKYRENSIV